MEFPASVIAEQITLFEYSIYSRITPRELIDGAWHRADKNSTSPKVVLMVERFNSVLFLFLFSFSSFLYYYNCFLCIYFLLLMLILNS